MTCRGRATKVLYSIQKLLGANEGLVNEYSLMGRYRIGEWGMERIQCWQNS